MNVKILRGGKMLYKLIKKNYTLYFTRATMPRKKFINRKTKVWSLRKDDDKGLGHLLGVVCFRYGWRQYVFAPENNTDWSKGCLEFVSQFLEYQNALWREEKNEKRKRN
jgi:hypothetical protein